MRFDEEWQHQIWKLLRFPEQVRSDLLGTFAGSSRFLLILQPFGWGIWYSTLLICVSSPTLSRLLVSTSMLETFFLIHWQTWHGWCEFEMKIFFMNQIHLQGCGFIAILGALYIAFQLTAADSHIADACFFWFCGGICKFRWQTSSHKKKPSRKFAALEGKESYCQPV